VIHDLRETISTTLRWMRDLRQNPSGG